MKILKLGQSLIEFFQFKIKNSYFHRATIAFYEVTLKSTFYNKCCRNRLFLASNQFFSGVSYELVGNITRMLDINWFKSL